MRSNKNTHTNEDEAYRELVAQGNAIIGQMRADKEVVENHKMRLGELAHGVTKSYGEGKLARFAKDIGMCERTLERCRSVYRDWCDAPKAATPPNFSVAQALQAHPNRFNIVARNRSISVRDARREMRLHKQTQKTAEVLADDDYDARKETKRWLAAVVKHAGEILREVGDGDLPFSSMTPKHRQILREEIKNYSELVPTLQEAGNALGMLSINVGNLVDDDDDDDDDDFDAPKPAEPPPPTAEEPPTEEPRRERAKPRPPTRSGNGAASAPTA
jgi:hypothetical protein